MTLLSSSFNVNIKTHNLLPISGLAVVFCFPQCGPAFSSSFFCVFTRDVKGIVSRVFCKDFSSFTNPLRYQPQKLGFRLGRSSPISTIIVIIIIILIKKVRKGVANCGLQLRLSTPTLFELRFSL